jgi:hypothetical protein
MFYLLLVAATLVIIVFVEVIIQILLYRNEAKDAEAHGTSTRARNPRPPSD